MDKIDAWHADGGYEKQFNYPLNSNSVVMDVGAYDGGFCKQILKRYNCSVIALEPISKFASLISDKRIKVLNFGLSPSNKEEKIKIYINKDGSSSFNKTNDFEECILKPLNNIMKDLSLENIDLLNINIEGAEYDLLDYLIINKDLLKIKFLQVQFHDNIIENTEKRWKKIVDSLEKTHKLIYRYKYVWESWELK